MMAMWPFSRRKKSSPPDSAEQKHLNPTSPSPASMDEKSALVSAPPRTPRSRQPTPRQPSPHAFKKAATAPLPAGVQATASPKRKTLVKKQSAPGDGGGGMRQPLAELRNQRREGNNSRSSLSRDADFAVIPTLKPSTHDGKSLRSKKSIRSKGDKERIKSLRGDTSPIPIPKRPLSDASGDLHVKDIKRAPSGFGRPASQVSLPLAESLNDEFVADRPESMSYKVNAFDVFAPHPKIKYAPKGKSAYDKKEKEPVIPEGDFGPKARINELADDMDARGLRELMDRDHRRRERKRKLDAEKLAKHLEKKDEKEKEKRPKSRRSKGKGKERAKPESEAQDTKMGEARSRSPTPEALPTLGGPLEDNPFYTAEEIARIPVSPVHRKFRESRHSPVSPVEDPFAEPTSAVSDKDDPIVETIETAKAVRLSQASMSPPASPVLDKRPTRLPTDRLDTSTPDIPELPEPGAPSSMAASPEPIRRDSEASSNRTGGGWTSFFRRKTKGRTSPERGRATPSESGFSNTSRESFKPRTGVNAGPSVAALSGQHRSFRRSDRPQRTQSKFREDLPDVPKVPEVPAIPASVPTGGAPMSPPRSPTMSRAQSRGAASPDLSGPPSPYVDRPEMLSTDAAVNAPMDQVHPALRGDVVLSRHQSMRSNSYSRDQRDSGPSAALLSQSLASVDSEGSWLSGRPSKRSSSVTERNARTGSKTSLALEQQASEEGLRGSPIVFGRRISNPGQRPPHSAQATGTSTISTQLRALRQPGSGSGTPPEHSKPPTPIPFGEAQVGEQTQGALGQGDAVLYTSGIARTPTVVQRERNARKSREGLLDIFDPQPSSATIETADDSRSSVVSSFPEPPARNTLRESVLTARPLSPDATPEPQSQVSTANTSRRTSGQDDTGIDEYEHETQTAQVAQVEVAEITEIKRATSVSLRNRTHARQMSAGSAKLLDLQPRGSGEMKRGGREPRRESWVDTPTTPSIPEAWKGGDDKNDVEDKENSESQRMTKGLNLFE